MIAKCYRQNCRFEHAVAHMDEAIDVLRQHYRAVHPSKYFNPRSYSEFLENYNLSVDEILDQNNIGTMEDPRYDWRYLRSQCVRWRRELERDGYVSYPESTIAELERYIQEHEANNPQPEQPPAALAANPFGQLHPGMEYRNLELDRVMEEVEVQPHPVEDMGGN